MSPRTRAITVSRSWLTFGSTSTADPRKLRAKLGLLWEYGFSLLCAFAPLPPHGVERRIRFHADRKPTGRASISLRFRSSSSGVRCSSISAVPPLGLPGSLWERGGNPLAADRRTGAAVMARRGSHHHGQPVPGRRHRRAGSSPAGVGDRGRNGPVRARVACPRPALKCGKRFLVMWLGLMGSEDHADLALKAAHHVLRTFDRSDCHLRSSEMVEDWPRCAR